MNEKAGTITEQAVEAALEAWHKVVERHDYNERNGMLDALTAALPPLRAREEIARADTSVRLMHDNGEDAGPAAQNPPPGHPVVKVPIDAVFIDDIHDCCYVLQSALSLPAGQEWRDIKEQCAQIADEWARPAFPDTDAEIESNCAANIARAIRDLPTRLIAEPIVAERKEPIGFVNVYRKADCHELGGTDIYKTINQAKAFDASDYDKGYLGIGVVTLLAEQRPETK